MVTSFPQSENASAMHSVYSRLHDWRFPNVRKYFADTGYERYGLVEKIIESVFAKNHRLDACSWCKKLWLPAIPQVRIIVTRMKFGELYLLMFQVFWKATSPKKYWLLEIVHFVAGFPGNSLVSTDSRSGSASHNHFRFKLKKAVWAEKSWKMIYNVFWNRLKIMILYCLFVHIIRQLKTKLKKPQTLLSITWSSWWNGGMGSANMPK